jgi:hypothetical protein
MLIACRTIPLSARQPQFVVILTDCYEADQCVPMVNLAPLKLVVGYKHRITW